MVSTYHAPIWLMYSQPCGTCLEMVLCLSVNPNNIVLTLSILLLAYSLPSLHHDQTSHDPSLPALCYQEICLEHIFKTISYPKTSSQLITANTVKF